MEFFFGGIMVVGLIYLLLQIFGGIGDIFDFGVDGAIESLGLDSLFGLDFEADTGVGEATGLGCFVISAFLAGFGAVGLTVLNAGFSLPIVVVISLVLGYAVSRLVVAMLMAVLKRQYSDDFSLDDTIGTTATVTIDSAAGTTGEVMLEGAGGRRKYPVKEVESTALRRGDKVEVVAIDGRFLRVRKLTQ